MTLIDYTLLIFTVVGGFAVLALVAFLALIARDCVREARHLRARAREAAPALDDAVREAVRLRVVEAKPNVYVLADRRRNGAA